MFGEKGFTETPKLRLQNSCLLGSFSRFEAAVSHTPLNCRYMQSGCIPNRPCARARASGGLRFCSRQSMQLCVTYTCFHFDLHTWTQEYVNELPSGLFLDVLGYRFTYFWGPGSHHFWLYCLKAPEPEPKTQSPSSSTRGSAVTPVGRPPLQSLPGLQFFCRVYVYIVYIYIYTLQYAQYAFEYAFMENQKVSQVHKKYTKHQVGKKVDRQCYRYIYVVMYNILM